MELGPKLERLVEFLSKTFVKFAEAAAIRSAGGRVMFGCEFFLAAFLLIALAMHHAFEILAAVASWIAGAHFEFAGDRSFLLSVGFMVFSLSLVFVREILQLRIGRR